MHKEIIALEQRLEAISESTLTQCKEFEDAVMMVAEAIKGMHERMERIEKWILTKEKRQKGKISPLIRGVMKPSIKEPLNR